MSPENVEIIRGTFEEWAQTGELVYRRLDPEIEWQTRADLPDSGVYRRHDGVTALTQEWGTLFEDLRFEVQEYIDRGDCVVVPLVVRGRIRGSEQDVTMLETWVMRLCDGLIVQVHEYGTVEEGLQGVALEAER